MLLPNYPSTVILSISSGLFFAEAPPVYSSSSTAFIIIMQDQTCRASCKPHSSSATWLVYAMGSSSCWGLLAFVHLCSLCATYIDPLSASKSHICLKDGSWTMMILPQHVTDFCAGVANLISQTVSFEHNLKHLINVNSSVLKISPHVVYF